MARSGVVEVRVSQVRDFNALGQRWRDLEQRSDGSFFQSWTWVGCLAAERYSDPMVMEATQAGRTVALGLFNRVRRRFGRSTLHLGEAGSADLDSPYIEQNGILTEATHDANLTSMCLRPLLARHDLLLSGLNEQACAAVRHTAPLVRLIRRQPSWFVDLEAIRCSGNDYLAQCSANTRQQIRRSGRFFQQDGPIALTHAASLASAHTMLDQMANLHQKTWTARYQPGSFASPFFRKFHHALIETGFPRQEVTVIKITAGSAVIGFLYNFLWRGRVSAYQSGFAYRDDQSRAKPGLTCHAAAIQDASDKGFKIYDFLAGDDRYKRSLASQSHQQYWLEAGPLWSMRLLPRVLTAAAHAACRRPAKPPSPGPRDAEAARPNRQAATD